MSVSKIDIDIAKLKCPFCERSFKSFKAKAGHMRYHKEPLEVKIAAFKDAITEVYVIQQRSCKDTGKILGLSHNTMLKYLKILNFKTRTAGEQNHIDLSSGRRVISWRGEGSPNWKGGKSTKDGYVYITVPGKSAKNGRSLRKLEHVMVWEQNHKRPLPEGWHIHHKNGIRNDNRPCNLLALDPKSHAKETMRMMEGLKERIRELETENKLLQKALNDNQMLFHLSEN